MFRSAQNNPLVALTRRLCCNPMGRSNKYDSDQDENGAIWDLRGAGLLDVNQYTCEGLRPSTGKECGIGNGVRQRPYVESRSATSGCPAVGPYRSRNGC